MASRLLASALVVALLFSACGAPTPSPSPTATQSPQATPVPTPTQVPSVSAPITATAGGTVTVPDGPMLSVPAGGVAADTTATIKSGQPCVETGMHIPAADRTLAGTVSVSTRSFLVKFSTNFEGFGVMAVLVAAFNAVGESKSAIAFTRTR